MNLQATDEQLLQKIGTLVVMMDIQAAQYQNKIRMLEETIAELSKVKDS